MSDEQYDDLFEDEPTEQGEGGMKAVRDALKREAAKRKELEQELEKLHTSQRKEAIEKAVSAAGLPPAAVELAAVQVTDPAEVDKWIEEKRAAFGVQAPESTAPEAPQAPAGLSPEDVQKWRDLQNVQPGQYEHKSLDAAASLLDAADSDDDFRQRLAQLGFEVISS